MKTRFQTLFTAVMLILLLPAGSLTGELIDKLAPGVSTPLKTFIAGSAQAQSLQDQDLSSVRSEDISDSELRRYIEQAEAEGLTEQEAFRLARERGLPASEAQDLRSRIRELRAEEDADPDEAEDPVARPDTIPDETEDPEPIDEDVAIELAEEAAEEDEDAIFGHSLFADQDIDVFQTTDGARAPDSYIMAPGDQIRVNIFGTSQVDMLMEVNEEGYIQPDEMPKIFLKGLTLREVRDVLRDRMSDFYTFSDNEFALTIHSARNITVNVFGESAVRGSFTMSALNTAFNALAAAGGPSDMGSLRNIELVRGEQERRTIDIYEFMFDPSVQFDFDLRQNDIIYVPAVQNVVRIEGAVARPMRYELTDNEDLLDLIEYAGGVNHDTATDYVQIQRIEDDEPVIREWRLSEVLAGEQQVELQDGDTVRLRSVQRDLEEIVEVEGSVYHPGQYSLTQNPTLEDVLNEAQLRDQAKLDKIFVERRQRDESVTIIPVEWEQMQENNETFELERRDRVRVFDHERYRNIATLTVAGDVREPIERQLQFDERVTIENALELAGGAEPTAADVAYVFRTDLFNPDIVDHIRVDLTRDTDFELQPGDQLNVYDRSTYSDQGELSIQGSVNEPFETQFDRDLTIPDLLQMAGGFTRGAAMDRIDVFRLDISFAEGTTYDVISLEADSLYNLVQAPEGFRLQPFDRVVVRQIPQFDIGASYQITGEVQYTGSYPLESRRMHLSEVIEEAGGLNNVADPKNATLLRTHNNMGPVSIDLEKAMDNPGDESYDPIIFDEDIIRIPRYKNTVTIRPTGTRLGELQDFGVAQMDDAVIGLEDQVEITQENLNVIYEGDRSAKWYIENFAGGFADDADRGSVTVTTPSGKVKGTSRQFLFWNDYPDVEPGSTIALRLDPEEVEPAEEEPFDWDQAFQRSMQITTQLLTIMVLIDRLD